MATPTINPVQGQSYPALSDIMNLVRSLVNDSLAGATGTPGEGQIITNNPQISPFTQPFLNSAIREVYRELRNAGDAALIKDNYILTNLPVMNSPTFGLGQPDPSVQVYIGFNGYFDGSQINPNFTLPADLIFPTVVSARASGTNNPYRRLREPNEGLISGLQTEYLGSWEWRGDSIWMNGALQPQDIKIRYLCALPTFFSNNLDLSSTFVPILDSLDAIAYKTASKYAAMLGSPGVADLKQDAKEQMFQLKNGVVRKMQRIRRERKPFGNYNGGYLGFDGMDAYGQ